MASDSNPNPHKSVNHPTEDRTDSVASTDLQTAEEQSDGAVLGEKATNDVNSASSVGAEVSEESTELNGLVLRDSDESEIEAEVAEGSREGCGVGLEEIPRCNSVTEGAGVLNVAKESRERDGVVLEEIPRYNSATEEAGELMEYGELSSVKLGESVVVMPEADSRGNGLGGLSVEVGDDVVQELRARRDIEGVRKDLASKDMLKDSPPEGMQELTESRELSRVDLGKSGVVTLAADSQGMISGDKVVEELTGRHDFERVSKDLGSSIEVEERRELNGAVKEEIPKDSATEVAEELKERRQLTRVDLPKFGASTPTTDLQGIVSGVSGFKVEGKVVVESRKRGDLEGEVVELRDSVEGGEAVLARTCSELEVEEAPLSPNSSGYAGERGSSSSSIGVSEVDEIQESKSVDFVVGDQRENASGSQRSVGKGHKNEDDAFISWRKRKKHFLILSHSGKPIFSRYGDEHKLAGFSATLQAIISFVENGHDRVKSVRAGNHQVVFLVKGPIYLVCISCTEEPYESLKGQLELLYGQMILILTKSVNKCFEKNPKFDMTPLLGGTDAVFSSLIHSFNWNPATFLHAYTCVPLAYATRQAVGAILQEVANSDVLFSLIMCKHKVVSLAGAQKASLYPDDMLLLANFVVSSESFRTSEAFSPICLPRYNPFAFLHAYVHYFDEDIYLIMLTTSSDAFYHLKNCRMRIEAVLLKSNVLSEVHRSTMDGGMRIEDVPVDRLSRSRSLSHLGCREVPSDSLERNRELAFRFGGAAGLLHFIYRSIFLEQYVSSEFASSINSLQQQKRLYRAYQKLSLSVHHRETGPHKTHFRRDENYVLLCWVTHEFEFYAAFDPLADKAAAIKICNRVCQWVKDVETDIFLLGGSSFSW